MKHGGNLCAVMALVCATCLPVLAQSLDLPLEYVRYPNTSGYVGYRPGGWDSVEALVEIPEGDWKLPERHSPRPIYGWVNIGEQARLLMLDQDSPDAYFYNRAYFDANGNRDLTDDPAWHASETRTSNGYYFAAGFPGYDVESTVGGVTSPYSFALRVNYWGNSPTWGAWFKHFFTGNYRPKQPLNVENLNMYLQSNCAYAAELELDAAKYKIYLADANVNGRFDDWGKMVIEDDETSTEGDWFLMMPEEYKPQPEAILLLGKYLSMKGVLYEVDISLQAKRITLAPREERAQLDLPVSVERIGMMGQDGCVMSCLPDNKVLVAPGTYRLHSYVLLRNEPQGAQWQLRAFGNESQEVTALAGTTTAYGIGEPYKVAVKAADWSIEVIRQGSKDAQIELTVHGAVGESVADVECTENHAASQSPRSEKQATKAREAAYKILKADGEIVAQGNFEYG